MTKPYRPSIADENHYVNQCVSHFKNQTPASLDIQEAYALLHLSVACRGLEWRWAPGTPPDRMNLYFMNYAPSGAGHKSSVMRIHKSYLAKVFGYDPFFVGNAFTPQGLRDGMVPRDNVATIIHFDEMDDILVSIAQKGSNMAMLPLMLKELYTAGHHVTMLSAVGKSKGSEEIIIEDSYLCMIGNSTPAVTKLIGERHLMDGFMARMHIIMGEERRLNDPLELAMQSPDDYAAMEAGYAISEKDLIEHLKGIMYAVGSLADNQVGVEEHAANAIRNFIAKVDKAISNTEESSPLRPSFERLKTASLKISTLVAAGRLGNDGIRAAGKVWITRQDALDGVNFCETLMSNAKSFIELCIGSSETKLAKRVVKWMTSKGGYVNDIADKRIYTFFKNFKNSEVKCALEALERAGTMIPKGKKDGIYYRLTQPKLTAKKLKPHNDEPDGSLADATIPGENIPF